jgi:hypothetical protein
VTSSSLVLPCGSLQTENGVAETASAGQRTFDFPKTALRLGVASKTELRIEVPNYFYNEDTPSGFANGFADLTLGVKQLLGPAYGLRCVANPLRQPADRSTPNLQSWLRPDRPAALVPRPDPKLDRRWNVLRHVAYRRTQTKSHRPIQHLFRPPADETLGCLGRIFRCLSPARRPAESDRLRHSLQAHAPSAA